MNLCDDVQECHDPENGDHDCRDDDYFHSLPMNLHGGLDKEDDSDDDGLHSCRTEPIHDDGRHARNAHDDSVHVAPKKVNRENDICYPNERDRFQQKPSLNDSTPVSIRPTRLTCFL